MTLNPATVFDKGWLELGVWRIWISGDTVLAFKNQQTDTNIFVSVLIDRTTIGWRPDKPTKISWFDFLSKCVFACMSECVREWVRERECVCGCVQGCFLVACACAFQEKTISIESTNSCRHEIWRRFIFWSRCRCRCCCRRLRHHHRHHHGCCCCH